jgi:hypothetical protein
VREVELGVNTNMAKMLPNYIVFCFLVTFSFWPYANNASYSTVDRDYPGDISTMRKHTANMCNRHDALLGFSEKGHQPRFH